MKRLIGKILIIIGILTLSIVIYTNYSTTKLNGELVKQYKKISSENDKLEQDSDVVGVLMIPKINLEVIIKDKVNNENLKNAVAHFEETSMPGEVGNFAVAGHRAYTSNKFFSDLDRLEIDDEINVLSDGNVYRYIVNAIEIVTPDKVDVLQTKDKTKKEITLVTCTPKYIGSHRLIIKGKIIE